jgi:acyl carrier protein
MEKDTLDIEVFIKNLEQQFLSVALGGLKPESRFRDLAEWSSLQALIVIVSFDDDYGVTINSEELRNAVTVSDLFHLVINKIK